MVGIAPGGVPGNHQHPSILSVDNGTITITVGAKAVSYTHLNMYTRQINCPAWLESFLQDIQRPEIFSMSVDEIINLSFYSHTFFGQTFKKCFQRSFKSYIDELRFNHAKNLLATTQLSILDISLSVGYNSSSHFIHKFKQLSGITPLQFRNIIQHRK